MRTKLPDIQEQPDLKEAARIGDANHAKMRAEMRGNKPRPALEVGDIVLFYEEIGAKKG